MDFEGILRFAVQHNASDVHLQAGTPPEVRMAGLVRKTDQPPIDDNELRAYITSIAPKRFKTNIDDRIINGLDFSYDLPGVSRFRCSAYQHLGSSGVAMRPINGKILSIAELHMPEVVADIALSGRGLTLVTGTTGSGKSTTLASMLDLINQNEDVKIITIEDPVEYMHTPKSALIAQLEVGMDTPSFEQALRQALRQDPDVVLVGELRDMETLRIALRAADTGHQVFSTVHSASAAQTVERIIAMFPPAEHKLLLTQLAGNLEAIISQRLVKCPDNSRRPACEILRGGPVPTKYILEGRALELGDYVRTAGNGQQTFDQDLLSMFKQGFINYNEALANATNREQLSMAMRGISSGGNKGGPPENTRPSAAATRPAPAARPAPTNGGH